MVQRCKMPPAPMPKSARLQQDRSSPAAPSAPSARALRAVFHFKLQPKGSQQASAPRSIQLPKVQAAARPRHASLQAATLPAMHFASSLKNARAMPIDPWARCLAVLQPRPWMAQDQQVQGPNRLQQTIAMDRGPQARVPKVAYGGKLKSSSEPPV